MDANFGGTLLDYCQKMIAGEVPIPPVAQLIGMEMGYGPKATSSMGENGWTRDV